MIISATDNPQREEPHIPHPPVAIGGVGGSGTRVIADILIRLGYYLGSDLNESLDNLWFTLLFIRPGWFLKQGGSGKIGQAITIFERTMQGRPVRDIADIGFILKAAASMSLSGHDHNRLGSGRWPFVRSVRMLSQGFGNRHHGSRWGWKEPNTHIFLEHLADRYPALRYIHTIRHGLDMAFSSNQAQLYNWAGLFEVPLPKEASGIPRASFDYWLRANEKAISFGSDVLGERFLLVNFDELCDAPDSQVRRIVTFLGLDPQKLDMVRLSSVVRKPRTVGRHRSSNLSVFTEDDFNAVRRLGFTVEPPA